MKIEKLTENKIRIILKEDDIKDKSIDLHSLMLKSTEYQGLFIDILNKAKKELDFDTEGHKLLIEAFSSIDDAYIFTITKYTDSESTKNNNKRYLTIKQKSSKLTNTYKIFAFNTFDEFCNFCNLINKTPYIHGIFKSSNLYLYNNTYYLILNDINISHKYLKPFMIIASEFVEDLPYSKNFEIKLKEHGKIIIKKNAIGTVIKHFCI